MINNCDNNSMLQTKEIRALYNEKTIRIYQAYSKKIADEAIKLGTFGPPFKMDRMIWIKPSFLWMMYRSGWAKKDGQERILAIDIKREGFKEIIENAVLSSFKEGIYVSYEDWQSRLKVSEVRCQWDPDRDIYGNPLNRRAIQLGIRGSMVENYVNKWIASIHDITDYANNVCQSIRLGKFQENMLPKEQEYPLSNSQKVILGVKSKD